MEFRLVRASDVMGRADPLPGKTRSTGGDCPDYLITINTLEELMALQAEVGEDLIVGASDLWIYDDYME